MSRAVTVVEQGATTRGVTIMSAREDSRGSLYIVEFGHFWVGLLRVTSGLTGQLTLGCSIQESRRDGLFISRYDTHAVKPPSGPVYMSGQAL